MHSINLLQRFKNKPAKMWHCQFESLGTIWNITVDGDAVSNQVEQQIYTETEAFNQQFSRFVESSQANSFRNKTAGTYTVSAVFAELLQFAQKLKQETKGAFDPAVGSLLEAAGYDAEYCFRPNQKKVAAWQAPQWNITGNRVTIDGNIVFDFGGFGKGYWIDQISKVLLKHDYKHFLVDGGGDMFGTSKQSGKAWKVAVEKPGEPTMAISIVHLQNQAIAISDVFRRRWKGWHHTLDLQQKQPTKTFVGCAVVASTAMVADALTTTLAVTAPQTGAALAKQYAADFLITTDSKKQPMTSSNTVFRLL
jgi:thiamine biosynthesis lipoprotein